MIQSGIIFLNDFCHILYLPIVHPCAPVSCITHFCLQYEYSTGQHTGCTVTSPPTLSPLPSSVAMTHSLNPLFALWQEPHYLRSYIYNKSESRIGTRREKRSVFIHLNNPNRKSKLPRYLTSLPVFLYNSSSLVMESWLSG